MPTYPYGFPDEVIDPFMNRTGRGVLGNKPASGTEIIQELGEEHQRTGKWIVYTSADSVFQIAAHEETIPLEELYDACRVAREILTGKHAVGRVIARPFSRRRPATYERTPNRHDFSLEPRRPNYLSLVRDAGHKVYGVGKIGDIFAQQDIDEEFPTKSNVEGIQRTEELLRTIDDGLVFTNLVETDMLWGHRNDPVNFHRCLQDFDRRLPDLLDALRPNDLLILTSDHGCDPTTPSTDHSREHALLLAYVEGRNAARPDPRGRRVRRRRRDGQRVARRQDRAARAPGTPIVATDSREPARRSRARRGGVRRRDAPPPARRGATQAPTPRVDARATARGGGRRRSRRGACSRWAAAGASSPSGSRARPGQRSSRSTSRRAWSSSRASAASTRASRDVQALPFADGAFDVAVAAWMLYHVPDLDRALAELARVLRPGGRLVAVDELARSTSRSCASSSAAARRRSKFTRENGERAPRPALRASRARGRRRPRSSSPTARDVEEYVRASISMSPFAANLPAVVDEPFVRAPRRSRSSWRRRRA